MEESWRIERLVPGGAGLARLDDGRIGFVTGALPGDRIRPTAIETHNDYARAISWELVEAGPGRVKPQCPVAGTCGGCDWMMLSLGQQRRHKVDLLREALQRIGGLRQLPEPIRLVSAGRDVAYRNRLKLHVDEAGRVGLFAGLTHDVVEIPACAVSAPGIGEALTTLRDAGARHPGALASFSEIEVRTAPLGPAVLFVLVPRAVDAPLSEAASAFLGELRQRFAAYVVSHDPGEAARSVTQRWKLPGGVELRVPPTAFVQTNWAVNLELVDALIAGARARAVKRFLDLYAGAGNFALPLLAAGLDGVAVERSRAAMAAAREAASASGLKGRFEATDASRFCRGAAGRRESFDLVVLDPPRTGARNLIPSLSKLAPRWIALASCDPATLARDVKGLSQSGYLVDEVTAFDMFPHTHHVEALVWMTKRPPAPRGSGGPPRGGPRRGGPPRSGRPRY